MENEKRQSIKIGRAVALALLLLCFASCLFFLSSCGPSRGAVTSDAALGYCPVCRMKVKASDSWAAEIYYNDRTKVMFESPGDMLVFYTSPKGYEVDDAYKDQANIERIVVKDYQSKQATDAHQAMFVYKSKITGPMGADFLPFAKRADAEAFVAANGGNLLSLNEVTGEMARDLRK
ncbi:MAG TPA: nitrous oxide reductase accessory protein NosL [Blastocatellia bacterium]|nr:nitrous oxide reductase accessory protein NosL [Blastocatellia bacterium]